MARHTRGGPPRNESEKWAIDYLERNLPDDCWLISNIDITNQQGQRLEIDALVIGRWAVYLVEIKGYTGKVIAGERVWDLGRGHAEESPLVSLGYKARVLASRIRDRITGSMHVPWCQATVFVTGNAGAGLELIREPGCGSVCDASDVVETLTTEGGLTAGHVHDLTREQRELIIQVLGQVGRLSEIDNRLQAFLLEKELFRRSGLRIHLARLADDAFDLQFVIKQVERAALGRRGRASTILPVGLPTTLVLSPERKTKLHAIKLAAPERAPRGLPPFREAPADRGRSLSEGNRVGYHRCESGVPEAVPSTDPVTG